MQSIDFEKTTIKYGISPTQLGMDPHATPMSYFVHIGRGPNQDEIDRLFDLIESRGHEVERPPRKVDYSQKVEADLSPLVDYARTFGVPARQIASELGMAPSHLSPFCKPRTMKLQLIEDAFLVARNILPLEAVDGLEDVKRQVLDGEHVEVSRGSLPYHRVSNAHIRAAMKTAKHLGYSRNEVAKKAGLTPSQVGLALREYVGVTEKTADRIADAIKSIVSKEHLPAIEKALKSGDMPEAKNYDYRELKIIMLRNRITGAFLAGEIGISPGRLSYYLNGIRRVTPAMHEKIMETLQGLLKGNKPALKQLREWERD